MFATNPKSSSTTPEDACCAAEQAGRKVRALVDTATRDAQDALSTTEMKIRAQPVKASLIAAAAGFLLGTLLRRR